MSLKDELLRYPVCEIRPVETNPDNAMENVGAIYLSEVMGINSDDTIFLSIPQHLGYNVELKRNTRYSFLFPHESGMKTAHGVFLQRARIDNKPVIQVKFTSPLKKIQRRDFYRVSCRVEMKFQTINIRKEDFEDKDYQKKVARLLDNDSWNGGVIVDISGGGLKFLSEKLIYDYSYLMMAFVLDIEDKKKGISVIGKTLGRQPIPRSLMCSYRVQFQPEGSKMQNDIVSYVYAIQRKIIRR